VVIAAQESLPHKRRSGDKSIEAPDGIARKETAGPNSQNHSKYEPGQHAIQRKQPGPREGDRQERGAEETVLSRS
jgi:hypothetical protein